ncbi:MAG: hypothetical protein IIA45_15765, partial [Bacteroidetes bacterium]|nr:hypothetical protein [Bacteroidota bacterium]
MPLPKYICFIIISTFIFSTAQAQDNLAVYEIIDTIEFSKYPLLGPGSISRNGKSFYFSAEVNLVDYLCVIKRDNTKSNFGKIIFLEDEKGFKIEGSQATVSKKNKFISYRINESGAWNDSELVIAESTYG